MSQVVIIADDLSGAADCASAFIKAGMEAVVVLDREVPYYCDAAVNVIAIDADTRRMSGNDAARIHLDLFNRYYSPGKLFYKKIDSTLRGNFLIELEAIMAFAGLAIVAPAFPEAGRYTRNGTQFLNALPLEEIDTWKLERISGTAHIPSMLRSHGINAESVSRIAILKGKQSLQKLFETFADAGVQAIVCDAESESDLQTIAEASTALVRQCFWVGSAGLARHLPSAARIGGAPRAAPRLRVKGSIVTLVGSASNASRKQAECLLCCGLVERLEVHASVLRDGDVHPNWALLRGRLAMLIRDGHDLLIEIGADAAIDLGEGEQLCKALALLVAPFSDNIGALVATGGETARAMLTAIGVTGLRVLGEIEAGVPIALTIGTKAIAVITKAGAFGTSETLFRCHKTLSLARDASLGDLSDGHPANTNQYFR